MPPARWILDQGAVSLQECPARRGFDASTLAFAGSAGDRSVFLEKRSPAVASACGFWAPTMTRLLICCTCPRYERRPALARGRGRKLASAAKAHVSRHGGPTVQAVSCLAGCRTPCNAAIDDDGKTRIGFSGLQVGDLAALLLVAALHEASADGILDTKRLACLAAEQAYRPVSRIAGGMNTTLWRRAYLLRLADARSGVSESSRMRRLARDR